MSKAKEEASYNPNCWQRKNIWQTSTTIHDFKKKLSKLGIIQFGKEHFKKSYS